MCPHEKNCMAFPKHILIDDWTVVSFSLASTNYCHKITSSSTKNLWWRWWHYRVTKLRQHMKDYRNILQILRRIYFVVKTEVVDHFNYSLVRLFLWTKYLLIYQIVKYLLSRHQSKQGVCIVISKTDPNSINRPRCFLYCSLNRWSGKRIKRSG